MCRASGEVCQVGLAERGKRPRQEVTEKRGLAFDVSRLLAMETFSKDKEIYFVDCAAD